MPVLMKEVREVLTKACGIHPEEEAVFYRRAREVGLFPKGRPGYGVDSSAVWEPEHGLVMLLLLASGASPKQAPARAAMMASLLHVGGLAIGPGEGGEVGEVGEGGEGVKGVNAAANWMPPIGPAAYSKLWPWLLGYLQARRSDAPWYGNFITQLRASSPNAVPCVSLYLGKDGDDETRQMCMATFRPTPDYPVYSVSEAFHSGRRLTCELGGTVIESLAKAFGPILPGDRDPMKEATDEIRELLGRIDELMAEGYNDLIKAGVG